MSARVRTDSRIERVDGVLSTPVDDDIVLLAPILEGYVGLNPIGRRVWELLREPRTVEELCRLLSAEYDASEPEIFEDLVPFLESLEDEQLIRIT